LHFYQQLVIIDVTLGEDLLDQGKFRVAEPARVHVLSRSLERFQLRTRHHRLFYVAKRLSETVRKQQSALWNVTKLTTDGLGLLIICH
jgi:hypothetical protein